MSVLDKHGAHIMLHSRRHDVDRRPLQGRVAHRAHREHRGALRGPDGAHRPLLDPLPHDRRRQATRTCARTRSTTRTTARSPSTASTTCACRTTSPSRRAATPTLSRTASRRRTSSRATSARTRAQNFVGLTSDATPATYWLVNGDNYTPSECGRMLVYGESPGPDHECHNVGVRLGLKTPAWIGAVVDGATFLNYDRPRMVAVGGFARRCRSTAPATTFPSRVRWRCDSPTRRGHQANHRGRGGGPTRWCSSTPTARLSRMD